MDSPDCLLILLSISMFLLFSFFLFFHFLPRDAMHPRYFPWPCVRPSVRHQSVLY